jgi:hypothetical protein
MMVILTEVKWNLSVVLIFISFMARDGEHVYMVILAIKFSSFEEIKVSHYHCVGVHICFLGLQSMFDEIGCTDVGCIQVDNCYFLLVYFSFY